MSNIIDLRKYNINTDEDAIAFLELFANKAPQLIRRLKSHSLEHQSLLSRVQHAEANVSSQIAHQSEEDIADYSVAQRLKGDAVRSQTPVTTATIVTSADDRIEQMRAAAAEAQPRVAEQEQKEDPLNLPSPEEIEQSQTVAPGEIGSIVTAKGSYEETSATTVSGEPKGDEDVAKGTETDAADGLDPSNVSFDLGPESEDVTVPDDDLLEPQD